MAEENNTSTTISEGTQTNARIQYFDILEGTETKYNDVPIVVDDSQVYLNNPTNTNNILARTLKDALFAKFDIKNINGTDYLMQSGYHDIDLDVWSVAQALANVTGDVNKRLYGIYEDSSYSKNNFLQEGKAIEWLRQNTGFTVDQINQIVNGLTNTSLIQELFNLLNSYNAQMYAIPLKGYILSKDDEGNPSEYFNTQDNWNNSVSNKYPDDFIFIESVYNGSYPYKTGSFLKTEDIKKYYVIEETREDGKHGHFPTQAEAERIANYFLSHSFADLMTALKGDWFASLSSDSINNTAALAVLNKDEIDNMFLTRKKEANNA